MKQKELWINQIKGLCICLVVIYHSVITFYPHLTTFQHPLSEVLSKCWIYFNLYLAPFRMPVFFFNFRLFDSPLYRQRTVGKLSR